MLAGTGICGPACIWASTPGDQAIAAANIAIANFVVIPATLLFNKRL